MGGVDWPFHSYILVVAIPYDDYQAIVYPVLACALALTLIQSIDSSRATGVVLFSFVCIDCGSIFLSNQ